MLYEILSQQITSHSYYLDCHLSSIILSCDTAKTTSYLNHSWTKVTSLLIISQRSDAAVVKLKDIGPKNQR